MPRKTSPVRKNLVDMLYISGPMTAYDAFKHYVKLFSKTTMRNVYYQLETGETKGKFEVEVKEEQGEYGWGSSATKKYYCVGKGATPDVKAHIKEYFDNINKSTH